MEKAICNFCDSDQDHTQLIIKAKDGLGICINCVEVCDNIIKDYLSERKAWQQVKDCNSKYLISDALIIQALKIH